MKVTQHAKMRIRERTELNTKERKRLFRRALDSGKSKQDIKDDSIRKFVEEVEERKAKVKIYQGYVFIYSKNKKTLYTMYQLPEELLKRWLDE